MALSMDEQRMLDEIERRLADEDPVLAARLTAFGPPGLRIALRSGRGRMLATLIALVMLTIIAVAAYAVVPLAMRHAARPRPAPASSQSAPASSQPAPASPASASRGASASGPANGPARDPAGPSLTRPADRIPLRP